MPHRLDWVHGLVPTSINDGRSVVFHLPFCSELDRNYNFIYAQTARSISKIQLPAEERCVLCPQALHRHPEMRVLCACIASHIARPCPDLQVSCRAVPCRTQFGVCAGGYP